MILSIIMPVYNGEDYIEESITSAMRQSIEDKELICIDDGSTDNTVKHIEKMKSIYGEHLILIRQENQGAAVARNKGLDIAKGEFVAFLDADDYYANDNGLEILINTCKKMNVNVCGSFRINVRDGINEKAPTYRDLFINSMEPRILYFSEQQYDYYYQSYVFKRKLIEDNKVRFPLLRRYQDPPFFAKVMTIAEEYVVVPIEHYCYRLRKQPLKYSFVQINDTLNGILMNVQLACKNGFDILIKNSLSRLNKDFYYQIRNNVILGDYEAINILSKIDAIVGGLGYINAITILNDIRSTWQNAENVFFWKYQFPYNDIRYGSDFILYGAGNVGQSIYHQIIRSKYANIDLWVDKKWNEIANENMIVSPIEDIKKSSSKYILIAVKSKDLFQSIVEELMDKGLLEDKKVIGPINSL